MVVAQVNSPNLYRTTYTHSQTTMGPLSDTTAATTLPRHVTELADTADTAHRLTDRPVKIKSN